MIAIESLKYEYTPGEITFENVNLAIRENECVALLGPSGCGKSTLLRLLMGVEKSGSVSGILRIDSNAFSFREWTNDNGMFSVVTQLPHLLPWKNVMQNLMMVLQPQETDRAREMLEIVGLAQHAEKFPHELSQGMASRVSFARALLIKSRVLLADEPFAALDAVTRLRLQDWYCENVRNRRPSLFVTHDIIEAMRVADRIVCWSLRNAKIDQSEFRKSGAAWERDLEKKVVDLLSE